MRRLAVVVGMVMLATGIAACGSDSVTSPGARPSMVGSWSLLSIDGVGLPIVVPQGGGDQLALVSDVITADSSGGFTEQTLIETTVGGQMAMDTVADGGTYALSGSNVALTFRSDSTTMLGTLAGDTLSLADGSGGSMRYARK